MIENKKGSPRPILRVNFIPDDKLLIISEAMKKASFHIN